MLFKTSFTAAGLPGYLLRLTFLVNLFLVYCQSRQLTPVIQQIKSASKTPALVTAALLLLGGCLLFAMLFTARLQEYLATSGL